MEEEFWGAESHTFDSHSPTSCARSRHGFQQKGVRFKVCPLYLARTRPTLKGMFEKV